MTGPRSKGTGPTRRRLDGHDACAPLAGCSRENVGAGVSSGVDELKAKLLVLEATAERLTKHIEDLTFQQLLLRTASERYQSATFDPADKGYGRLDTSGGTFLVSVEDAKPFLDGYKIAMKIGNIQSIGYRGYTIKATWGSKWERDKDYQKWKSSLKTKEVRMTEQLVPGAWNRMELTLAPAKAADIGHLEIEMVTDVVVMATR